MFLTLDKWRAPEEIFRLSRIAIMPRESTVSPELEIKLSEKSEYYRNYFGADIIRIASPAIEISSSAIRAGNDELRHRYLPEAVFKYVTEHRLYEQK